MSRSILAGLLAIALAAPMLWGASQTLASRVQAESGFDHSHAAWTGILKRHAKGDGFDYGALKKGPAALESYLQTLASVRLEDFQRWDHAQRYAFWINAYNAFTIQRVIEGYPIRSIKSLGSLFKSIWKQRFIPLGHLFPEAGEEELNLDELEHAILRPTFRDARVHAAINCASKSCPPLLQRAFAPSELDLQLDAQARAWLADPDRNRFEQERRTVHFSKIFEWFEEDFERDGGSVLGWVAKYAPAQHAEWLKTEDVKVRYLDYDWSLNDTKDGAGD